MADPLARKTCIACCKEIIGRPVELRPPDPQMALCRSCSKTPMAASTNKENTDG